MKSTHTSFENKHPPGILELFIKFHGTIEYSDVAKRFRRVYATLVGPECFVRKFFFLLVALQTFAGCLSTKMETQPVKTQELGLMKATGLGNGGVEGVYISRIEYPDNEQL